MPTQTRRRHLQHILAACGVGALGGCATILHPEQRGNHGGRLDVGPLILDILWFIPGLVPGIIALVVDFGTGAIYTGHGSADAPDHERLAIKPGEEMTLRAPIIDDEVEASLRLIGPDGQLLDETKGEWKAAARDDLKVAFVDDVKGPGHLELELRHGEQVHVERHPIHLGVA